MQISEIDKGTCVEETQILASTLDHVASFMKRLLKPLKTSDFDRKDLLAIEVAVEEALVNAVKYGNQMDGQKRVHLWLTVESIVFRIVIRDEGRGFDSEAVPDPTDPDNLERPTGRGLLMIRHYMHEVTFNAKGNEVTLVRRRTRA